MIRPAKFVDVPRLVDLLVEMQAKSRYADTVQVDRAAAHKVMAGLIQRNGHTNDGGTLVNVAVADGEAIGFMAGILDRIYHVGDKLVAQDVFLYVGDRGAKMDTARLIGSYLAWAKANDRVHEIKLSWTDTMPGAEKIGMMYERLGFRRCGEIWERSAR